jgi:hypothetical protein
MTETTAFRSVQLIRCESAGSVRLSGMNRIVEQVSKGNEVFNRCHNAGSHHALLDDCVFIDQRTELITNVREGQRSEWARTGRDTKAPYAQGLWHVVGVYCGRYVVGLGHKILRSCRGGHTTT